MRLPTSRLRLLQFQLTPTALDFGSVKVGKRRQRSLTIKNIGAARQTVLLSPAPPFSLRTAATVMLKSGKRVKVKVQFAPTAAETFTGTVVVTDPVTGDRLTVLVTGVGVVR